MRRRLVVGCRVRPVLESDPDQQACIQPHVEKVSSSVRQQNEAAAAAAAPTTPTSTTEEMSSLVFCNNKKLSFDHVFFPDDNHPEDAHPSSPSGIYNKMIDPLVEAVTEKYFNASALIYGQTGAGKTTALKSLIPRVVSNLVAKCGVENLMFRMVEIYGDNLRDLLSMPSSQQQQPSSEQQQPKLHLRESDKGLQMTGATVAVIESEDDANWLFEEAFRRRATAATNMNSCSSRSHAIFTIFCTLQSPDGDGVRVTKLNLVDLAGSERQKKTQNVGVRMKESVGINRDLLALGNVLRAVAANQNHVPYRQCKLTRLLQDSIGGGAVATFLACVSPLFFNKDETLRTLHYCAVASTILNTPAMVAAPPPPPPPPAPQQQQQPVMDDEAATTARELPSASSLLSPPPPAAVCKQCPILAAALDRSENHAFQLEQKLCDLQENLDNAQTDLKKDEKIFVLKFRDARRLEKENIALRQRIVDLESEVLALRNNNSNNNPQQQQHVSYVSSSSLLVSPCSQPPPHQQHQQYETENNASMNQFQFAGYDEEEQQAAMQLVDDELMRSVAEEEESELANEKVDESFYADDDATTAATNNNNRGGPQEEQNDDDDGNTNNSSYVLWEASPLSTNRNHNNGDTSKSSPPQQQQSATTTTTNPQQLQPNIVAATGLPCTLSNSTKMTLAQRRAKRLLMKQQLQQQQQADANENSPPPPPEVFLGDEPTPTKFLQKMAAMTHAAECMDMRQPQFVSNNNNNNNNNNNANSVGAATDDNDHAPFQHHQQQQRGSSLGSSSVSPGSDHQYQQQPHQQHQCADDRTFVSSQNVSPQALDFDTTSILVQQQQAMKSGPMKNFVYL